MELLDSGLGHTASVGRAAKGEERLGVDQE